MADDGVVRKLFGAAASEVGKEVGRGLGRDLAGSGGQQQTPARVPLAAGFAGPPPPASQPQPQPQPEGDALPAAPPPQPQRDDSTIGRLAGLRHEIDADLIIRVGALVGVIAGGLWLISKARETGNPKLRALRMQERAKEDQLINRALGTGGSPRGGRQVQSQTS